MSGCIRWRLPECTPALFHADATALTTVPALLLGASVEANIPITQARRQRAA